MLARASAAVACIRLETENSFTTPELGGQCFENGLQFDVSVDVAEVGLFGLPGAGAVVASDPVEALTAGARRVFFRFELGEFGRAGGAGRRGFDLEDVGGGGLEAADVEIAFAG